MTSTIVPRRSRRPTGRLTDLQIRNIQTPELKPDKYPDGNSLYLQVFPTGRRSWCWNYKNLRGAQTLQLGTYPEMSLAQARAARNEARQKLLAGTDPVDERRMSKRSAQIARGNSFESVARAWHARWSVDRHPRYTQDVMSRFERNVFPHLGRKPVSEIEPPDVVRMMEVIQERGAVDIAKRARDTCNQVFRYAITKGLAKKNPAAEFKPSDVLARRPVRNHARIDESELPTLLRKVDAYQGTPSTRLAMKLLALTFVRTSELIGTRWTEIDFDKAEWRLPAERMKMRSTHIVPLAPQAVSVLRTLHTATGGGEFLFPGDRNPKKCMSNNTILKALERMGYKGVMTGHGFRGLASTHLHEKQFPHEHIELQLAHMKRDKVAGAYDWAKHLTQRRAMMEYWANFLEKALKGSV
jgi:integrase